VPLEVVYKRLQAGRKDHQTRRLAPKIELYDAVKGFRSGLGTSIAIIETKLHAVISADRQTRYFAFLISRRQTTLWTEREHTIAILRGYGTGANLLLINTVLGLDTMVPKQAGFEQVVEFGKASPYLPSSFTS
jgi:hypothetical protein